MGGVYAGGNLIGRSFDEEYEIDRRTAFEIETFECDLVFKDVHA